MCQTISRQQPTCACVESFCYPSPYRIKRKKIQETVRNRAVHTYLARQGQQQQQRRASTGRAFEPRIACCYGLAPHGSKRVCAAARASERSAPPLRSSPRAVARSRRCAETGCWVYEYDYDRRNLLETHTSACACACARCAELTSRAGRPRNGSAGMQERATDRCTARPRAPTPPLLAWVKIGRVLRASPRLIRNSLWASYRVPRRRTIVSATGLYCTLVFRLVHAKHTYVTYGFMLRTGLRVQILLLLCVLNSK